IRHSLIDGNEARASQATTTADGGGILSAPLGATAPGVETLTISDSTIAFNTARVSAGIMVADNPSGATTLTRVTVAHNTATANVAGGIGVAQPSRAPDVAGSILAANLGTQPRTGAQVLSNCAGVVPVDGGGNLESGTDCGFTGSGSRQDPNTGLATALVGDGGMLPVLPISADSPARDLAGVCSGTDQRDVTRPQGDLCDAGAYEYLPPPPEPTPIATAQPTVAPTPAPSVTPVPVPTPVVNKTVVARKVSGKVLVRLRGSGRFVELDAAQGIPVGSTVDARKGVVELTSQPRAGAPAQTAVFYDGIFKVTQTRGITDLRLTEKLARCGKRSARAAAKKAKRPKKRRLWGDGKGSFRTTGRYSAATVRGTKWLVQDSCNGTLTRVKAGSVKVRDKVRKRTKVVRAGKKYLARPKR
ncbi:MAG TPA: choice-of-anchor Q domain-containing protein, partial [Solirubrobacter sp.]|nr:choice-of-anchor Q domain-containing protein [Solirubrobacter sp.]